jgi:hypothetical protein
MTPAIVQLTENILAECRTPLNFGEILLWLLFWGASQDVACQGLT